MIASANCSSLSIEENCVSRIVEIIEGREIDFRIIGEKWSASILPLTTIVQKSYGSEIRRLHR